jgi:hypothetical protein
MPVSKLSDKTRLLGASLKNLNPTSLFNKTNEVVDTLNYNASTLLGKKTCSFTDNTYTVKYNSLIGVISPSDTIQGSNAGLAYVTNVTADTISFRYDVSTSNTIYPFEPVTDLTSGATFTLDGYIGSPDQEIELKGGNRYIITNIVITDPTNSLLTCNYYEFLDISINTGTALILFNGTALDLKNYYVDYLVSNTIVFVRPKIVTSGSLYLNIAGVDPTAEGNADVYVYGIALD